MKAWELKSHGRSFGYLRLRGVDQPFFMCDFEPTPAFAEVAQLFAAELASMEGGDTTLWEKDYAKIDELDLELSGVDEAPSIHAPLLHIEGATAWFRY
jgi:hypothetical protein